MAKTPKAPPRQAAAPKPKPLRVNAKVTGKMAAKYPAGPKMSPVAGVPQMPPSLKKGNNF